MLYYVMLCRKWYREYARSAACSLRL